METCDSLIDIVEEQPFQHLVLPTHYMNAPLVKYKLALGGAEGTLVATNSFVDGVNRYRQYFVTRGEVDYSPRSDDVVLDCGACIGDIGLVFALLVGKAGHVHLFDPMPAHVSFCQLQAEYNPNLASRMTIVAKAVGAISNDLKAVTSTINEIRPDAIPDNTFPFISIDDYVRDTGIRVDVIKMDIEGGEIEALKGAAQAIRKYHPRLLISAYHRHDDLWRVREIIHEIDPSYIFHFGHHTPVQWESVLYAV